MARKEGSYLKGVVGNVSLREQKGQQIISSKKARGTTNQSVATKASNKLFGKGAALAAGIREIFDINKGSYFDSSVNERLVSGIRKILSLCQHWETKKLRFTNAHFKQLVGFEFNNYALMEKFIRFKPRITKTEGILQVSFDKLSVPSHFQFPLKSFKCEVSLSLGIFNMKEGLMLLHSKPQSFAIHKNMDVVPPQQFSFDLPADCLCILRMSLEFFVAGKSSWKHVTAASANPSSICAAVITPGLFVRSKSDRWLTREKFIMA